MTEEEKNNSKRKEAPLTISEKFGFFFMPYKLGSRLFPVHGVNDTEIERFQKYGFENKLKEIRIVRKLGMLFYVLLILILVLLSY